MPEDVPPQPSAKPKLPVEERRRRQEDRLVALRLRMAIGRELDEREITDPVAIGAALGLPAGEAVKLLTRHQWREGDVALLAAATVRLGLPTGAVPEAMGDYVDPPAHAVVLSVDEKSRIQALDHTQPGLPMKKGRCGTMTHDYVRNGTTTLLGLW